MVRLKKRIERVNRKNRWMRKAVFAFIFLLVLYGFLSDVRHLTSSTSIKNEISYVREDREETVIIKAEQGDNTMKDQISPENVDKKTEGESAEGIVNTRLSEAKEVSEGFLKEHILAIRTDQKEVTASHIHDQNARAPWDPIAAGERGHSTFQKYCHSEINATGCKDSLPLDLCLRMKVTKQQIEVSESCSFILNPCQPNRKKSKECSDATIFTNSLTDVETKEVENLLALVDQASFIGFDTSDKDDQPLNYWMTAGSMIGSLAHHGMIPWDDDVDIYVRKEHMDSLFKNIKSLGLSVRLVGKDINSVFKVYNASLAPIPKRIHTYPYIDVFPVDCSDGLNCIEYNSVAKNSAPVDSIFPLKRRPFGRLSMPFPVKVREIVENRYGLNFKKYCKKGAYNHRKERFTGRQNYHSMNCSDMLLPPPFVFDRFDAITNHTLQTADIYTPWAEDFPNLNVEHIVNDGGKRLSSVVYDDGNEIRRSYADGLLQMDDNAVTYSIPSLLPNHQQKLVPFLVEERLSFRSNRAGRSAKEINLEVLPVLDRVVISNEYGFPSHDIESANISAENSKILHVGEWNAARGLDWDVFPNFYPIADIIILNEMDLGMARSGNRDTTKAMSKFLKMNYAYGVEFLELTNGNKEEINITMGKSNLIGYHGNAVLTKWPIIESKIVRLHPLYDLLFEEKSSGIAKGERRLGGRMALFTLIQTSDFGDILAISIHAHAGSKQHLLKSDAKLMCDEIQKYSTTNVIIGGDIASPIPQNLVSDCGFFALEKTNSQKGGKGSRLMPTWRLGKLLSIADSSYCRSNSIPWKKFVVSQFMSFHTFGLVCPDGNEPRTARYPTRGDFILVKGSGFDVVSNLTEANTIYPYRKHEGSNGSKPRYECVSDHALLSLDILTHAL